MTPELSPTDWPIIGGNIKRERLIYNAKYNKNFQTRLSQTELASMCEFGRNTISSAERGKVRKYETYRVISRALRMTEESLLSGTTCSESGIEKRALKLLQQLPIEWINGNEGSALFYYNNNALGRNIVNSYVDLVKYNRIGPQNALQSLARVAKRAGNDPTEIIFDKSKHIIKEYDLFDIDNEQIKSILHEKYNYNIEYLSNYGMDKLVTRFVYFKKNITPYFLINDNLSMLQQRFLLLYELFLAFNELNNLHYRRVDSVRKLKSIEEAKTHFYAKHFAEYALIPNTVARKATRELQEVFSDSYSDAKLKKWSSKYLALAPAGVLLHRIAMYLLDNFILYDDNGFPEVSTVRFVHDRTNAGGYYVGREENMSHLPSMRLANYESLCRRFISIKLFDSLQGTEFKDDHICVNQEKSESIGWHLSTYAGISADDQRRWDDYFSLSIAYEYSKNTAISHCIMIKMTDRFVENFSIFKKYAGNDSRFHFDKTGICTSCSTRLKREVISLSCERCRLRGVTSVDTENSVGIDLTCSRRAKHPENMSGQYVGHRILNRMTEEKNIDDFIQLMSR